MSSFVKIEYGILSNKIDITVRVFRNPAFYNNNNMLFIPKNDVYRAKLFGDPIKGASKFIFIHLGAKKYKLDAVHDIYVDMKTQTVYLNNMPNIPDHIKTEFKIDDKNRLYQIHDKLSLHADNFMDEMPEQLMSLNYITGHEKILEIGSNIGRNTVVLSHLLSKQNNNNLVTLESDTNTYNHLMANRELNKMTFMAENAALSKRRLIQKGWNTIPSETLLAGFKDVNLITFEEIKQKYNIEFDTLVLDCEGAFYYILQDMPEVLSNINMVIMENDYRNKDHYDYVSSTLIKKGMEVVYSEKGFNPSFPTINNFYEVWKTKQVTEPVIEPVIESVTEPVIEPVIESATELVTEPVIEPVIEPVTEPVIESVTEHVAEPVTELVAVNNIETEVNIKKARKKKNKK